MASHPHPPDDGSRSESGSCDDPFALSRYFLHFAPSTRLLFEAETSGERSQHLRRSILVGLLVYNAYDLTDLFLVPDVALLSIALRLLLVTPVALVLAWRVPTYRPRTRESVVTAAMIGVVIVPVLALAVSRAPFAGYTFAEIPLVLVFGGMMLVLETAFATFFMVVTATLTTGAVFLQPAFAGPVALAILLQIVTACAFVGYGNRQIEIVRRRSYVSALRERLRSEGLETVRRELVALSATDALTGLANRRALDTILDDHEAAKRAVGLIMIDIDHFKLFNDAHGHVAGDACIRAVAQAAASAVRPGDVVARFGGEEFAVVIETDDVSLLWSAMERLRSAVQRLAIQHDGRTDGLRHVTISAGCAVLPLQQGASRLLIDLADSALYEAKKAGRDTQRAAAPRALIAA